jgi:hypothetical protein
MFRRISARQGIIFYFLGKGGVPYPWLEDGVIAFRGQY